MLSLAVRDRKWTAKRPASRAHLGQHNSGQHQALLSWHLPPPQLQASAAVLGRVLLPLQPPLQPPLLAARDVSPPRIRRPAHCANALPSAQAGGELSLIRMSLIRIQVRVCRRHAPRPRTHHRHRPPAPRIRRNYGRAGDSRLVGPAPLSVTLSIASAIWLLSRTSRRLSLPEDPESRRLFPSESVWSLQAGLLRQTRRLAVNEPGRAGVVGFARTQRRQWAAEGDDGRHDGAGDAQGPPPLR